ncbi:unnamed protein product [Peniophora sp. CBMAI 1063]|nr:unnamed protein product [Peniophora sp. CBMAI 1063]
MSRPPTPGLFSSVLGYLTREVTDFVVSAAGGEPGKATPHVDARKERDGRSERERRKERKRRRVQSQAEGQVEGEDVPASGKAQRKRRSHEDEQYDASAEDGQKSSRRRISPPSPDSSRAGPSNVAPEPSTSKDAEPAPAPRRRKRRPSITMPGSLYPRTPSVEPDSPSHSARTPSPQPQPQPHSPSNPSRYVDYQIPLPPSRPSTPSQWVVSPPRGKRVGEATRRFSEDGDARLMLPKHPHSPNHRAEKSQSSSNAKGKGRERERELPAVFDSSDSSSSESDDEGRASPSPRARKITRSHNHDQENEKDSGGGGGKLKRTMSVGGIERELVAVRQAHAQKEAVWEDRDVGDSTVVQDERREYLERIQGLEAEVQRLRAELL